MKYTVTLEAAKDSSVVLTTNTVELEALNVNEVRTLAKQQNPGYVVKKVRRQKQSAT